MSYKNPEKQKEWIKNNRDKVNKIAKKYYDNNKIIILERANNNLEYKQRQKDRRIKERIIKPWIQHLYSARARCNNKNHKSYKYYGGRGIECYLTREDIEKLWFRNKAYEMIIPSIDREDNNWHYTLQNCRFIEHVDNIKKSNIDRKFRTTLDYTI